MSNKEIVHIRTAMNLADKLVAISEKGFTAFGIDECLVLNRKVSDSAYRLRKAAEQAPPRIRMANGHFRQRT